MTSLAANAASFLGREDDATARNLVDADSYAADDAQHVVQLLNRHAKKSRKDDQSEFFDTIPKLSSGDVDSRGDAYADLMRREQRVLDVVDRVVNDARGRITRERLFTNLTLTEVLLGSLRTVQHVIHDLTHVRKLMDVQHALWDGDRKIYVGLLLVAAALVIFFSAAC